VADEDHRTVAVDHCRAVQQRAACREQIVGDGDAQGVLDDAEEAFAGVVAGPHRTPRGAVERVPTCET
jgi:hypothetical protein